MATRVMHKTSTGIPQFRRWGIAAFGASRPLWRISAIVSFPNPQPALSLVAGNRSSCPIPVIRSTGRDRLSWVPCSLVEDVRPEGSETGLVRVAQIPPNLEDLLKRLQQCVVVVGRARHGTGLDEW